MQRLVDQVAIVTGGATGIGGATARRFAEEGARVLVVDFDAQEGQRNVDRIRAADGVAELFVADVGSVDGVQGMVESAVSRWGKLNIVVNNAYSGGSRSDALSLDEQTWDRALDVGLKSMFRA